MSNPERPKRVTKRYLESIKTYSINIAKWQAATEFANKNGMKFQILTEDHIPGI